jgi:hypothetical protein
VPLTKLVGSATALKKTTELVLKPVPFMVNVNAGAPAPVLFGTNAAMLEAVPGVDVLDP